MKQVKTKLRWFKNIVGRPINVLTKHREPDEIFEAEVPLGNVGRQTTELWITSPRQEIDNLISHKYIEEVEKPNGIGVAPEDQQTSEEEEICTETNQTASTT